MKNIHVLPTDKPSEFYSIDGKHKLANSTMAMDWYISSAGYKPHNIYITNDEKIKEGDWYYYFGHIIKYEKDAHTLTPNCKKIILTTDPILIQSGVQAIPNDFLEWLVQNPSCEEVEVEKEHDDTVPYPKKRYVEPYKIILPQEEHKQTIQ
jgi:hypothetical protein